MTVVAYGGRPSSAVQSQADAQLKTDSASHAAEGAYTSLLAVYVPFCSDSIACHLTGMCLLVVRW